MSILSKVLFGVGIIQLLHAGFSSYEFHQLLKSSTNINESSNEQKLYQLPNDIKLEVFISLAILTVSIFLSFNKLKYYPINNKNDEIITEGEYLSNIQMSKASNVDNLVGSDPTGYITYLPNMVDIQAKRKEVAEYLKTI
ncbi:hypothetical protein TBLA_0D04660 [Henningerozyma blattae CBS 6284]|uniref:ER membrane protein complex subunit 5 n=1 Tax=Henningerozyma blattae (strain ATCC 34711 / CBS 6284 / DSM 70876 / NBRC 10599 / NRRL Y-10934 / UCD 77-7) TaxID=1071380 RepID=I2H3L0_HENB6|nr:hypothetical protein TBLA_0D04660 [Tetrapisispora blattae CBS 6284]CCH60962.1 hypothetical protein TBLA_0D04660 [Tetrapisispora blattae CBS 6284]